ncbi:MAG: hypothetical protein U0235_27800 [Polyangiaceae bacterium]
MSTVEFAAEGVSQAGTPYKSITKYVHGDVSPFTLGLSLRRGAYLTHATAVFLHGLTQELPKTIYVNKEQSPKPRPSGPLLQAALDRAFSNKPRESNYVLSARGHRYVILSGKHTERLEVSSVRTPNGDFVDTTNLERTLIDIVVRPSYAGGPQQVLAAYVGARERMSVGLLLATLRKLAYVYPYHQAIGFYMQRAGYKPAQLERVRGEGASVDFYLANRIRDPGYDSTWRVFFPPGL